MSPTPQTDTVLATYLQRMIDIKSTGAATSEMSYYSALENLLNEIGRRFVPPIHCNGQLRNQGHDHPDFGLYSHNQINHGSNNVYEIPKHGVIEVKPLSQHLDKLSSSDQFQKYLDGYGLVMVTNYREFRLYRKTSKNGHELLEAVELATDEQEFWDLAVNCRKTAKLFGTKVFEFLRRTLNYTTSLSDPQSIAWLLASYAKETLTIIRNSDGGG